MGINMKENKNGTRLVVAGMLFLVLPIVIYGVGDKAQTRTIMKDSVSILTILAFFINDEF